MFVSGAIAQVRVFAISGRLADTLVQRRDSDGRDRLYCPFVRSGEPVLQIWVDADACPAVIKEILFRAANRWQVNVTFVANQMLRVMPSPRIRAVQVERGFDVADHYIVERSSAGDLVVTGDIPLAADVLAKGGLALSPRGEMFDSGSIGQRLQMRDMLQELRDAGVQTSGPASLSQTDRRAFANALDGLLNVRQRKLRSGADAC